MLYKVTNNNSVSTGLILLAPNVCHSIRLRFSRKRMMLPDSTMSLAVNNIEFTALLSLNQVEQC